MALTIVHVEWARPLQITGTQGVATTMAAGVAHGVAVRRLTC